MTPLHTSFALLDDRDGLSRCYSGLVSTLNCREAVDLPLMLQKMQQALAAGLHAVVVLSYELGAAMQGIAARSQTDAENMFDSQILLFADCRLLNREQVDAWLAEQDDLPNEPAGIAQIKHSVTEAEFHTAIARIHDYIEAGDAYQIDYTYRVRFTAFGGLHGLYRRLRARQPVPFGALIALPDGRAILSLSPELFLRHVGGTLTAQPMKGTAPACDDPVENARRANALAADAKNRAENLMIVDLLRNDLGRVARTGSVSVPALFEVQRFASVLQMTSTVQAALDEQVSLTKLIQALFPCGSITGAPKHRSMQIIRELEPDARGVYCGAIGWFDAPMAGAAIGDFCLSVPIRTLALQPLQNGVRQGEMGIGSGIVYDSIAADELAECRLKADFLTSLDHAFHLFETMHVSREEGVLYSVRHSVRHLQRLKTSADFFGFTFDVDAAHGLLQQHCAQLAPDVPHRLRLALMQSGILQISSSPITPLAGKVKVKIAPQRMCADDLFLRHKSSVREVYDAAWRAAEQQGAFDMLFFNETGALTEGGRSNVFIKQAGQWLTPPLEDGVLPGVMRAVLLNDPIWNASERRLTLDDLRGAEAVIVCNALRGVIPVTIDWT